MLPAVMAVATEPGHYGCRSAGGDAGPGPRVGGDGRMARRGPLVTLGAVLVLAVIFLWANTLVAKPVGTAAPAPAASGASGAPARAASAGTAVHALYAGRSSGDQVTVAIAINGRKAAADLNAGLASEVSLQGTVNGSQVTMTAGNGIGLDGFLSGADMFGTITGFLGQSFPFSAAQAVVEAIYAGRSSGNQVTLAVVTDGDKAAAYVCNGRTVEAWLQGSVRGNQVNLTGLHGADLTGSLSGLAMFGMVTPAAGLSFPFSAELSPRPAGVYQARITVNGLATRVGWAVLPDGTQVGVVVAGTARYAAPPLDLSNDSFSLGGASFRAAPVAGDQTVVIP
jgi:hypothetical protein